MLQEGKDDHHFVLRCTRPAGHDAVCTCERNSMTMRTFYQTRFLDGMILYCKHPAIYIFPVSYRMCCFVKKIMRHTQEQMQAAIKEWQDSGQSKKAFCRDRKITYPTFHYWFKRLSAATSGGFSEVKLPKSYQPGTFELTFPSGARMIFQCEPSAAWLRELLN